MNGEQERLKRESELHAYIRKIGGAKVLSVADAADLEDARSMVLRTMADGDWHRPEELERVGGREALRRLRELRGVFDIEKERVLHEKRCWVYRLRPRAEPESLFGGGRSAPA